MVHYYSEKQGGEFKPFLISVKAKGISLDIYSADGIFSKSELDFGSRLLIERSIVNDGDFLLDIGCGNGVVGISLSKIYKISTVMTDTNERAVSLSKMNIEKHKLKDAKAKKSNLYDNIAEQFDVILSNPPQTAGKEVCFGIIDGAFSHLKKDGTLQLVARPNKGGKTLAKKMEEVFGNVSEIARGFGFALYLSRKS